MELAEKRGVSAAQISLAWMLSKPQITAPIIGATKVQLFFREEYLLII